MPLQETQTGKPGAKTIAGGTIGATAGMQGSYALKELMRDEAHPWGRYFKNKPLRRATLGAGLTAGGFLGGLGLGTRFEKKHQKREAGTLLKQSSVEKADVASGAGGAIKGLAATKLYQLYKHQSGASSKRLAAMGLIGAAEGIGARRAVKKIRHGRND